jgi:hypothetical protein
MSKTINVLLNDLTEAIAPINFKTRTVEVDGKDVKQFSVKGGKKADWLNASDVESLTINNDVAESSRIAEKGFTYRWVKADLSQEQVELIGAVRFKNAIIRICLGYLDLEKRCTNMSKNFTLNFDAETVETMKQIAGGSSLKAIQALESRPEGMKRQRKAGEKKVVPEFTM